ncbi:hypothetical protein TCDM_06222 [Trypanosoma cruzi Dm28c]|uniref:Uncharacterized protein n=2 Tax=Trypanosoma cruzi TaxID=5693 RepID=V5AX32_TRYCR|nr:hypothetical protein TCDM_06222 [Trypanosoma cruzi Dm28c]
MYSTYFILFYFFLPSLLFQFHCVFFFLLTWVCIWGSFLGLRGLCRRYLFFCFCFFIFYLVVFSCFAHRPGSVSFCVFGSGGSRQAPNMPLRRFNARRGMIAARRGFFTATSPCCQSRLVPFHELFAPLSSSSSPSSPRRFPVHSVCVDSPLGTLGEPSRSQGAGAEDGSPLSWLRENLQLLEGGRKPLNERRASMPEGSPQWPRYMFPSHCCDYIYDPSNDSKLAFVTSDNYCHLCHEPVEVAIQHCAWWDHVTRLAAIRLIAIYPRRWSPVAVLREANEVLPTAVMVSPRPHPFLSFSEAVDADDVSLMDMSSCYVFEREAVVRRAELAAILRVLCTAKDADSRDDAEQRISSIIPVLRESLFLSANGTPAASSGERTFRAYISRQISVFLPPMAPEPTTRIQQRCWGRKNLEIMFDLLGVASLQRIAGAPVEAVTKNEKAAVLRQIIYELATVLSEGDAEFAETSCAKINGTSSVDAEVQTRLLAEMALQRLAHELIHLHTMLLMDQAYETYVKLGYPSEGMLERSGFC